ALGALVMTASLLVAEPPRPALSAATIDATVAKLVAVHGAAHGARIREGVAQVAARWWPEDGDTAAFEVFCVDAFIADAATLDATAARLERVLEQADGHLHEVRRELLT